MRDCSVISVGNTFGSWTVVDVLDGHGGRKYLVECECGQRRLRHKYELRRDMYKFCAACRAANAVTTPHWIRLYRVWQDMRGRCGRKSHKNNARYGARGIAVCEAWSEFRTFWAWSLANGYRHGLQIDRIDNNGPYSPDNCRWTSRIVNGNNRSDNVRVSAFGESKTIAEWSRDSRCKVRYKLLHERIRKYKYLPEEAMTTPSRQDAGIRT